jgi:hypothetical protein
MHSTGAKLIATGTSGAIATRALEALAEIRGAQEHPGRFPIADHPWTDHLARLMRDGVDAWLTEQSDIDDIHVVAAQWRTPSLLTSRRVRAGEHPLYDIAWRSYPADGARLMAQRLIAECVWKGGWPALARAADRLAQARADLKVMVAMDDPDSLVGQMTLAEACAFRISAFAPKGDHVMLAYYGSGGADSWRDAPGFALFDYVTGDRAVTRRGKASTSPQLWRWR